VGAASLWSAAFFRSSTLEILPFLTGLKEIVVTVAAAIGAFVAVRGLTTWKAQLSGKAEYEVAVKFLRAVTNCATPSELFEIHS
jgi:hypothetical protein